MVKEDDMRDDAAMDQDPPVSIMLDDYSTTAKRVTHWRSWIGTEYEAETPWSENDIEIGYHAELVESATLLGAHPHWGMVRHDERGTFTDWVSGVTRGPFVATMSKEQTRGVGT